MKSEEKNEVYSELTLNTVLIKQIPYEHKSNLIKKKSNKLLCCYKCIIIYYVILFFCILLGIIILLTINEKKIKLSI